MAIETVSQEALGIAISPAFDLSSALVFFVCLGLFCYAKFTKTANPFRRRINRFWGHMIWVSGLSIAARSYLKKLGTPAQHAFVIDNDIAFRAGVMGVWTFALA